MLKMLAVYLLLVTSVFGQDNPKPPEPTPDTPVKSPLVFPKIQTSLVPLPEVKPASSVPVLNYGKLS